MKFTLRSALVLTLCLTSLGTARADWTETTFAKDRFSAMFPAAPKEEATSEDGVNMRTYSGVGENRSICLIVVADYPNTIDPPAELKASRENFAKGVEATVSTSKDFTFMRGSAALSANEFDAASAAYNFRSIIVVDGKRAYQIAGGVPKSGGDAADLDRCVRGLKLTVN